LCFFVVIPEGDLLLSFFPSLPKIRPTKESPKNNLKKVGVFLPPKKHTAKTPHQPRKSPQLHHQNTTTKTRLSAKPPTKTLPHHANKIIGKQKI
jgi:hypothetical protein